MAEEQSITCYRKLGAGISLMMLVVASVSLWAGDKYYLIYFLVAGWMLFLSLMLDYDDMKKVLPCISGIGGSDAYVVVIPRFFLYGSYLFVARLIKPRRAK